MNNKTAFNLENEVNAWADTLKAKPDLTESDVEEMKSHLYDSIDALQEKGLNEKEAFVLARFRIGDSYELDEAYKEANQPVTQMRRSLLILAGVLVYFMTYYFILSSSKVLAIILLKTGAGGVEAIEWVSRYLITWHFIMVLFFAGLFFFEGKIIAFIEKMKLKPKRAVLLLAATGVLAIADTSFFPWLKKLLATDYFRDLLYHSYIYFEFSFPFLIGICFVIMYNRYYKKSKPV